MTREEIAQIIDPVQFTPFVVVTGSGSRFPVNHPDFVDLPPIPEETLREQVEVARYVHRLSTSAQQERAEVLRRTYRVLDEADGQAFEQAMDDARRLGGRQK